MSEPESLEDFQKFLALMFDTWTPDELAYQVRIQQEEIQRENGITEV